MRSRLARSSSGNGFKRETPMYVGWKHAIQSFICRQLLLCFRWRSESSEPSLGTVSGQFIMVDVCFSNIVIVLVEGLYLNRIYCRVGTSPSKNDELDLMFISYTKIQNAQTWDLLDRRRSSFPFVISNPRIFSFSTSVFCYGFRYINQNAAILENNCYGWNFMFLSVCMAEMPK